MIFTTFPEWAMTAYCCSHGGHGREVFQDGLSQLVHHFRQLCFERRAVPFLWATGMPGVPELSAAMTEVHSDMTDASKLRILFR